MSVPLEEFIDRAALLEAVVLNSQDAVLTKDLNGIITSWNPAAERMFGYMAKEIIGKSILMLISPELRHEEVEIVRKLKAGERIEHFETIRLTKEGHPVFVQLTISPLKSPGGEVVGASKVIRDISKQQELDLVQKRLAAIVESSDDAILSKDLNGTVMSWNAAAEQLFGYTPIEMIGQSILKLVPLNLHPEEQEILSKLRLGERVDHFETVRRAKDGRLLEVSLTISPVRDSHGIVIGASKVLRDVSERKKLQESLLQAEKIAATGRMAATIAHEINNPLEGLVNLIYLAKTTPGAPIEVVNFLTTAEGELQRISHIAKQTLGFYKEHTSPVPLSLSTMVTDVLSVYEPRLRLYGIHLETEMEQLPKIVGRGGELSQVVSNLVVNAIHAMQHGGTLRVTLRAGSEAMGKVDGAMLEITDTGSGIAPENLEQIFEPFFTTRGEIGTGIGLWIAKQFVEGHSGRLSVSSAPDKGATMRIFLPWENAYGNGGNSQLC